MSTKRIRQLKLLLLLLLLLAKIIILGTHIIEESELLK